MQYQVSFTLHHDYAYCWGEPEQACMSEPHTSVVYGNTCIDQPKDWPTDRPTDRPCLSHSRDTDKLLLLFVFVRRVSLVGQTWAIYRWGWVRVVVHSGVHGVGLESPRYTPALHDLHTHPSMTSTKRSRFKLIGASLSEPHTSVTSLCKCVCIYACLLGPTTYRKF